MGFKCKLHTFLLFKDNFHHLYLLLREREKESERNGEKEREREYKMCR